MRILSIIFPGARLARMANRARNVTRRAYGIAAGYYPPEYRRVRIPFVGTVDVPEDAPSFYSSWGPRRSVGYVPKPTPVTFREWGSDAGHVRYTAQGFRTPDRPPTLSAYRPSGRARPYQDAPVGILLK